MKRTIVILLFIFQLLSAPSRAQDDLQQSIAETLDLQGLGSGYAAMGNFAVVPDISAATYHFDVSGGHSQKLKVFRIPFKMYFQEEDLSPKKFVEFRAARQTVKTGFPTFPGETLTSYWKTNAVNVTGGIEYLLGEKFTFTPAVEMGIARIRNNADYMGELGNTTLKPALEGVLFDWHTKTHIFGGSLSLDYTSNIDNVGVFIHSSFSHNKISSFDSSSEFIDFNSQFSTMASEIEFTFPTSMEFYQLPVSLVTHLATTTFFGDNRDALGFSHFFELGLSAELDVTELGMVFKRLRVGVKAITAKDLHGWTLDIGYRF